MLSCSRALWERTVALAAELGAPVHTHLLESEAEEAAVRASLGTGQMEFLSTTGVLDADLRVAHAVWLREPEMETLGGRPLKIAHCPSANLKLGSGVADLPFLRAQDEPLRWASAATAPPATTTWTCWRRCASPRCCKG